MATLHTTTSISTRSVGDTLPVADWNNAVGILNGANPAGAAYLTTTITLSPASTTVIIGFNGGSTAAQLTSGFLVGGMTLVNSGTNNCCLIAPVAGYYLVAAQVGGAMSAPGYTTCYITKNQTAVAGGARTYVAATGSNGYVGATGLISCAAGDAIGFEIAGSVNVTSVIAGAGSTYLHAALIS